MRHASGTIGPSKSAYSIVDGAPMVEPAFTVVRPSRSRTVASYSRFSMRRSCVVAGMPGAHAIVPLPPPEPGVPPEPVDLLPPAPDPALLPPDPELDLLPPEPELPSVLPIDPVQPARPATRDPTRPNVPRLLARLLGIKRVMCICPSAGGAASVKAGLGRRYAAGSWKAVV